MKKMLVLLFVLSAMVVQADVLEEIDRAVEKLGSFASHTVPDEADLYLVITPFLSDRSGENLLGNRLKSELELYLASTFSKTRILDHGEGLNAFSLTGEIQAYSDRVRIICKVFRPDGSLSGGTRVEILRSSELELLLQKEPSSLSWGVTPEHEAAGLDDDPFEPDDIPGFELEVPNLGSSYPGSENSSFARILTPGDIDRFRFYQPDAGTVVLETITAIDTQLLLYREGEKIPFAVNDNWGETARIEAVLEEGYYIAEILAYDFDSEGKYTLNITLSGQANDRFEPDNARELAQIILPGGRQERALLPGDEDWVELSFTVPGFYQLFTTGLQLDTSLKLVNERGLEITHDDDSGELTNAHVGFFLGRSRFYAKITTKNNSSGPYSLHFAQLEPKQLFPNGTVIKLEPQATPHYLRLRILQAGKYVLQAKGEQKPPTFSIFILPQMRAYQSDVSLGATSSHLLDLTSGDFLLRVKDSDGKQILVCIAAEGSPCGPMGE
ncbi:MAG TPA: hypothetical protein ENI27_07390 [bacterium]|nr:hypothetical protein [bacterium]